MIPDEETYTLAEGRRSSALDFAIALAKARGDGTSAAQIVTEAKKIEAYLRGDAEPLLTATEAGKRNG